MDIKYGYWSSGRCPCLWQGGWNQMIFKVPSDPYHSMILYILGEKNPQESTAG